MIKKIPTKKRMQYIKWIRIAVQIVFFIFMPEIFSQAFAGVKETVTLIGKGEVLALSEFVKKFLILFCVTLIAGRIFCGWACAFGAFGDWVYGISSFIQKKIKKKLPKIPEKFIPALQKTKYLVLIAVLVICFAGKSEWITKCSPWTIFSLVTARNFSFGAYKISLAVLLVIIVGMAVKERFFCQFLCPLGAIFAIQLHLPFLRLKRNKDNCIPNCNACRNNCPVSIKLQENELWDGECITCGRCKVICPKKNIQNNIQNNIHHLG